MRRIEAQKTRFDECWKSLSALERDLVYLIANIDKCTPRILAESTGKSRPTITTHLKKLLKLNIIQEHSSSLRDPTKYYSIK